MGGGGTGERKPYSYPESKFGATLAPKLSENLASP